MSIVPKLNYRVVERVYHEPHFKVNRPTETEMADMDKDERGEGPIERGGSRPLKNGRSMDSDFQPEMRESRSNSVNKNATSRVGVFGHHKLPKGERKDFVGWPLQLAPYLSCQDLNCQCLLFGGSVIGPSPAQRLCILPNGKPLTKAIRREYRTLSHAERSNFVRSMEMMRKSGLYHTFSIIHRKSGVHSGPGFFPWHREFIKRLEMVYRTFDPMLMGLPYWDSTLDNNLPNPEDSVMFSEYLMGDADPETGDVINGPYANWTTMDNRPHFQRLLKDEPDGELLNEARIDYIMNQTEIDHVLAYSLPLKTCFNYTMNDRFLEYSHDYVHYFISGDMIERFSSSNDPIFFMHHGMTRRQREQDYPADNGECMPTWHFSYNYMTMQEPLRNIDALSNKYTDHLYEYAPRPSCKRTRQSAECNSEFLFCDDRTSPFDPVCCAMIKPGGNCTGFEWSNEVCYKGRCIDGKCTKPGQEYRQSYEKKERYVLERKYM
ncbi:common central domain of tyrosinase domain-containing protein [Ditylenchus destructor]|nr:common central domain of tyrosinase domain-containing protein [Ditylenchus destructor]